MANKKQSVATDWDDVVVHFMQAMFDFHNARYGTSVTFDEITTFDLEKLFGCDEEEKLRRVLEFYLSEEHARLPAVEGAVSGLERLAEVYDVYMITARPSIARACTEALIERYVPRLFTSIFFTDYHYTLDPAKRMSKANICDELEVVALIDDGFHNAVEVARSDRKVLMPHRPWNRGKEYPNVIRVQSWDEIINHLLPAEAVVA
jgi:5'(3')-deoxyribonucleotidase